MDHTQVAQFLTTNPLFFEEHAELLGTIKLSSPLLGRAVSLQERQMEIMRDKYRHLELRLSELLHLAQENDSTLTKFQRWSNSLLLAKKDRELPGLLTANLQEFFSLPHASLRLWNVAEEYQDAWFAGPISEEVQLFARGLHAPFCGENNDFEAATWIDAPVASVAMLPLRLNGHDKNATQRHESAMTALSPASEREEQNEPLRDFHANEEVIGLLVLGSSEKNRYTNNMATHFLTQIADTSSAALSYLVSAS